MHILYFKQVVSFVILFGASLLAFAEGGFRLSEVIEASNKNVESIDACEVEETISASKKQYNSMAKKAEQVRQNNLERVLSGKDDRVNTHTGHSTLIFVSYSLPDAELKQILKSASEDKSILVVMRGIPKGSNLGQGIKHLQKLAMKYRPMPSVVINPLLFTDYGIDVVPAIVKLDASTLLQKKPKAIASVKGILDPIWLTDKIKGGAAGDLGVMGPIQDIKEQDFIQMAKDRMADVDFDEMKKGVLDRYLKNMTYHKLPPAKENRTRKIDPSVYVAKDIKDHKGNVLIKAGEIINPMSLQPFSLAVFFFDPTNPKQIQFVKKRSQEIFERTPGIQHIYVATHFETDRPDRFHAEVSKQFDGRVYLLQEHELERFKLEYTPSVVTGSNTHFVVEEVSL